MWGWWLWGGQRIKELVSAGSQGAEPALCLEDHLRLRWRRTGTGTWGSRVEGRRRLHRWEAVVLAGSHDPWGLHSAPHSWGSGRVNCWGSPGMQNMGTAFVLLFFFICFSTPKAGILMSCLWDEKGGTESSSHLSQSSPWACSREGWSPGPAQSSGPDPAGTDAHGRWTAR